MKHLCLTVIILDVTHEIVFFIELWDWLPWEIQDFIISLAVSQQLIDLSRQNHWKILHDELRTYHKLKEVWALGYIRYRIELCLWTNCRRGHIKGTERHLVVKGCYVDLENTEISFFWAIGSSRPIKEGTT